MKDVDRVSRELGPQRGGLGLGTPVWGRPDGAEVILAPKKVRHARDNLRTALFVLSITVERAEDGTVIATGGTRHSYDPWRLDDGILTPLGYRYQVPGAGQEFSE